MTRVATSPHTAHFTSSIPSPSYARWLIRSPHPHPVSPEFVFSGISQNCPNSTKSTDRGVRGWLRRQNPTYPPDRGGPRTLPRARRQPWRPEARATGRDGGDRQRRRDQRQPEVRRDRQRRRDQRQPEVRRDRQRRRDRRQPEVRRDRQRRRDRPRYSWEHL